MEILGTYKIKSPYGIEGVENIPYIVSRHTTDKRCVQTIEYKGENAYRRTLFLPDKEIEKTINQCKMEIVENHSERADLTLMFLQAKEEDF